MNIYKADYEAEYPSKQTIEIGYYGSELLAREAIQYFARQRAQYSTHNSDNYGVIYPRALNEYWPTHNIKRPAIRFTILIGGKLS